jgi:hypothetical protein
MASTPTPRRVWRAYVLRVIAVLMSWMLAVALLVLLLQLLPVTPGYLPDHME